jgi:aspartyl-tRNA(Asn)/glutamyl-tRNA(Gln) amidotransferase subunit B
MRFDVNISLAEEGAEKLGTRAEIKNLNSFRSIERAVEYEIKRQTKILESGEAVKQETRGWSDATGETTAQRSKEEAKDYRYMPEPDLPPLKLSQKFIDEESAKLPLMPADYREKFSGIIPADTLEILLDYPALIEKLAELSGEGIIKRIANLFTSVLLAEENFSLLNDPLPSANQLTDLATMLDKSELSSTGGKEVFLKFFDPEMHFKDTKEIAKELGVIQENDLGALEAIVDAVLAKPETQKAQEDYKAGEVKVIGFLVGQVMKESHGKANPSAVQEILKKKLA